MRGGDVVRFLLYSEDALIAGSRNRSRKTPKKNNNERKRHKTCSRPHTVSPFRPVAGEGLPPPSRILGVNEPVSQPGAVPVVQSGQPQHPSSRARFGGWVQCGGFNVQGAVRCGILPYVFAFWLCGSCERRHSRTIHVLTCFVQIRELMSRTHQTRQDEGSWTRMAPLNLILARLGRSPNRASFEEKVRWFHKKHAIETRVHVGTCSAWHQSEGFWDGPFREVLASSWKVEGMNWIADGERMR